MSRIVIVILIYHRYKPIDLINKIQVTMDSSTYVTSIKTADILSYIQKKYTGKCAANNRTECLSDRGLECYGYSDLLGVSYYINGFVQKNQSNSNISFFFFSN
jgi:hypothetical protein